MVSALITSFAIAASANASVLNLVPSGRMLEGVSVSKTGTTSISGRSAALTTVGAGVRSKKVVVVNVKVYVTQVLVSDASHFVRTAQGALASVAGMQTAAIQLNFLHDVDADTIQSSFREALDANGIDMNGAGIRDFLEAVRHGGNAATGQSLKIVVEKLPNGTEAITYEDVKGVDTTVAGPAGMMRAIFSIWLGVPADPGLADLKNALIKG